MFQLVVLSVMASILTGCAGKYTGGGWIPSAVDSTKKATFGGNLTARDTDGDLIADKFSGQWEYHDKAAGVDFHVDDVQFGLEVDLDGPYPVGDFFGTYKAQPSKLGGGNVLIIVSDLGNTDLGVEDVVVVAVLDGPFAGYVNAQQLGGGNIQFHR
jgi:hypothetical protein